jgi:AbrB family looped-hinge helix DNA binding protein
MEPCTTTIDKHGRVVIPAEHRRALGLQGGDTVVLILKGNELQLVSQQAALKRAQDIVMKHTGGKGSLVEELLAERRAEVAGEQLGS